MEEEAGGGMAAVLDFDILCATVALQTRGILVEKRRREEEEEGEEAGDEEIGAEFAGVQRMWEGDIVECFDDRRIAIETACCPCYRFGKNMRRASLGSCFLQATVYLIFVAGALFNFIAFGITDQHRFLYLGVSCCISTGLYLGFFRARMKKQFNIKVQEKKEDFTVLLHLLFLDKPLFVDYTKFHTGTCLSFSKLSFIFALVVCFFSVEGLACYAVQGNGTPLDDCLNHLICPCCTLCQESRTLEMNNVQDGVWHGRGDTICLARGGEGSTTFIGLRQPPLLAIRSPIHCSMERTTDDNKHSWSLDTSHSKPLVPADQLA